MPIRPCPTCNRPTLRVLAGPSAFAYVNYYRCETCGHVWHTPKDDPNAEPTTVMQGRSPDK
jgi:hypothetical protein